jgi:hypothetical protein
MWSLTQKNMVEFMGLKKQFAVEELFTNQFLPGKL